MAKAMIHSYDGRVFKINYFHGKTAESPGIIILYSKSDKKNLILQRNLVLKTFNIFKEQGFHILMIDLSEISPTASPAIASNGPQTVFSSNHNMASIMQDCYTCIEYFLKIFPKMHETWICSFSYESILALQITMRMLTLEKFILICPKIFGFDTQNISSCTAEGLIVYVNGKKKKELQTLHEVVGILRNQKKVLVDCVKIDTNEEYLHNKYNVLEDVINLYIKKNYASPVENTPTTEQSIIEENQSHIELPNSVNVKEV